MLDRVLADIVVITHLLFIVFALLGGLLLLWRGALVWLHLPAAIWIALISFQGWICPLTSLENRFRLAAGAEGYSGGFVENYIIPLIYPVALSGQTQVLLGIIAVVINASVYAYVLYRRKR